MKTLVHFLQKHFDTTHKKGACKKLMGNTKGFTLIEIMVVIGIIGILAGIAIPNFLSYRAKSFCSAVETDANNIKNAIADYYAVPNHRNMIDINDLKTTQTGSNVATIDGDLNTIIINVIDGSGQCPDVYMRSTANWNTATSTFTKTIP